MSRRSCKAAIRTAAAGRGTPAGWLLRLGVDANYTNLSLGAISTSLSLSPLGRHFNYSLLFSLSLSLSLSLFRLYPASIDPADVSSQKLFPPFASDRGRAVSIIGGGESESRRRLVFPICVGASDRFSPSDNNAY